MNYTDNPFRLSYSELEERLSQKDQKIEELEARLECLAAELKAQVQANRRIARELLEERTLQ
jgi:predicted RNase H-like nuclease (RuvC/YqgF family)